MLTVHLVFGREQYFSGTGCVGKKKIPLPFPLTYLADNAMSLETGKDQRKIVSPSLTHTLGIQQ